MRWFAAAALLLLVVGSSSAADQTYPIFTADQLTNTMKLVGRNFAAVNASLAQKDFETAKAPLTRTRELLAVTITFWKDRKKDDAMRILKDAVTKIDALDAALSVEKIDVAGASAIAKQIGSACQSCHALYREQDPTKKAFRVKLGSVQ